MREALLEAAQQPAPELRWCPVRQQVPERVPVDVVAAVAEQLRRPAVGECVRPGMRVAVAVGSRGISGLADIVRALVGELQARGASPFVVPAMGSHGGGTADGQALVLAAMGITEATVGAPVRSSMETVQLGSVQVTGPMSASVPVHVDAVAHAADAVVPVARIKPHTDFRGPVESGLHKMLAVGLGKHRGAATLHGFPLEHFGVLLPVVGQAVRRALRVPFGIAVVEDEHGRTAVLEAVPGDAMADREPELLASARTMLAGIPFAEVDVLVLGRIGKDISGAGMDPNVTGRFATPGIRSGFSAHRLVVLDLTDASRGNASGVGMADVVTARLADKIDWVKTYRNHVTAHSLAGARLPLVAVDDREAVTIAVRTLPERQQAAVRLVHLDDTLHPTELWVSEALLREVDGDDRLQRTGDLVPLAFDSSGRICRPGATRP